MAFVDTSKWQVMSEMSREEIIEAGGYLAREVMTALNTTRSILQRNQIPIDTDPDKIEEILDGEEDLLLLRTAAANMNWANNWIERFKEEAIKRDLASKFENTMKGVRA